MKSIKDYHQINDLLATSGQPTPQEFAAIATLQFLILHIERSCTD